MLSAADMARQEWYIRASLATLGSNRVPMTRRVTGLPPATGPVSGRDALVAQACAVGDRLEVLAARTGSRAGWAGLALTGDDEWSVNPAGPDLYDGTAGIVYFLAYLAEVTGEERYRALALEGAAGLAEQVRPLRGHKHPIGAFTGWGGLIHVYCHLAVLWDRPDLLDEARSVAAGLVPLIEDDVTHDVVGGAAGCIAALLTLHELEPSPELVSAAVRCGHHLVRAARPARGGLAWPGIVRDVPLGGFSHGASGVAWALLRLAGLSGEAEFRKVAAAALEYERSLFDPHRGNWADLRPAEGKPAEHRPMVAWCHGAAGIGMSRLIMLREDGIATAARCDVDHAVRAVTGSGLGGDHTLCHGDLGKADFLLRASQVLGRGDWAAEAHRMSQWLLDDIERHGWKCGLGHSVETPGLMTGLAGIGYGMLRMAEPRSVPSVLALAAPVGAREAVT